jgi:hypothetical protein
VTTAQTWTLLGLLERDETLRARGFSLSRAQDGGIVIDRWGHVRGIWDFDGHSYTWVTPSSSEPTFRTADAKSAVLYTVMTLA